MSIFSSSQQTVNNTLQCTRGFLCLKNSRLRFCDSFFAVRFVAKRFIFETVLPFKVYTI